jgi:hypothetical protein
MRFLIVHLPRFMAPTIPAGTPCVAIVWARLKVGTDDRGIRPFIVPLNDGHNMCPGVIAKWDWLAHRLSLYLRPIPDICRIVMGANLSIIH